MGRLILSQSEIAEITERVRPSAQIRRLTQLGIPFRIRADNVPIVSRAAFEQAMGAQGALQRRASEPDFSTFHAAQKTTS